MSLSFNNPDYDWQIMQSMASESDCFASVLAGLENDTDSDHPHNATWLGTLSINGKPAQVQLVVTQDANAFIDEY
jgi:hypothetical protein